MGFRVVQHWLAGPRKGESRTLIEKLPGPLAENPVLGAESAVMTRNSCTKPNNWYYCRSLRTLCTGTCLKPDTKPAILSDQICTGELTRESGASRSLSQQSRGPV